MLYTDTDWITGADLAFIDPETAQLGANIPLTIDSPTPGADSIIHLALNELGQEIVSRFQNFSGYLVGLGISANHVAAVLNTLSTAISRPRMQLNQVVVHEPNPTKGHLTRYAKYKAVSNVFRAAFHRKLDDKYEKKMQLYGAQAEAAWNNLISAGVPVVLQPLAAPAAIREYNSGTFTSANVTAGGSGSHESGQQYDVTVTYVAQGPNNGQAGNYISPTQKNNSESGYPTIVNVTPTAGQVITVSISTLNPPSGTLNPDVGTADGIYTPLKATGWNVYIGQHGKTLYLQNATPIPIATASYVLPDAPALSGYTLGPGQAADYNFSFVNVLQRA